MRKTNKLSLPITKTVDQIKLCLNRTVFVNPISWFYLILIVYIFFSYLLPLIDTSQIHTYYCTHKYKYGYLSPVALTLFKPN